MFGKRNVYVLGAGPAGMLATHAVAEVRPKAKVVLFSMPESATGLANKSELYGCQYLHQHIPGLGLSAAGRAVRYQVLGEYLAYKEKVYGRNWSGNTSVDEYGPEESHMAWDLRQAYDTLWDRYRPLVVPILVNSPILRSLLSDRDGIVLSTIPQRSVCVNDEHEFKTQDVWAMGSSPHTRPPYTAPDMTVQCNGSRDQAWYRAATVFGHSTLEWPLAKKPPVSGIAAVKKPLSTDCNCWETKRNTFRRLGRYGKWRKGVLAHTVYNETKEILV